MFKLVFTYLDCLGGGVSPPGAAQTQIKSSRWGAAGGRVAEGGGGEGVLYEELGLLTLGGGAGGHTGGTQQRPRG